MVTLFDHWNQEEYFFYFISANHLVVSVPAALCLAFAEVTSTFQHTQQGEGDQVET